MRMEKLPCYIKWFPSRVSMKQVFITSICREGIPGGGIVADGHAITCKTGKVTVSLKPKQILNLISEFQELLPPRQFLRINRCPG